MKRSEDGRWAHAACAFYTPGVLIETRGVCGINKVGAFPRCAFANSATSVTARAVSVIALRMMADSQGRVEEALLLLQHDLRRSSLVSSKNCA